MNKTGILNSLQSTVNTTTNWSAELIETGTENEKLAITFDDDEDVAGNATVEFDHNEKPIVKVSIQEGDAPEVNFAIPYLGAGSVTEDLLLEYLENF